MKTTNFENSKRLVEIGFNAESDFTIIRTEFGDFTCYGQFKGIGERKKAYHLETLLDALPTGLRYWKLDNEKIEVSNINCYEILEKKQGESLADTAARLLIKLYEEGLINFKK